MENYQPEETNKINKIIPQSKAVRIGLIVILVVFISILFTLISQKGKGPDGKTSVSRPTATPAENYYPYLITIVPTVTSKVSNLEIIEKVLTWLNKQKDDKGFYLVTRFCDTGGNTTDCNNVLPIGTSPHEALAVIWAEFKVLEKNPGNKNYLDNLDRDLNLYSSVKGQGLGIQNEFWNCKYMYDLAQSNLLSDEQKQKAKKICQSGMYYYPQEYFQYINNGKLIKRVPDLDLKKALNKTLTFTEPLTQKEIEKIRYYVAYPSDMAVSYLWLENDLELPSAKFYFNKAIQMFVENEDKFGDKENCLLGISSLDLYSATKNNSYFTFAKDLFAQKIESKIKNNQVNSPVCALFAKDLYNTTTEGKYKSDATSILNYLLENSFDYPGYKVQLEKNGSFFSFGETGKIVMTKSVKENALLVGALSDE